MFSSTYLTLHLSFSSSKVLIIKDIVGFSSDGYFFEIINEVKSSRWTREKESGKEIKSNKIKFSEKDLET